MVQKIVQKRLQQMNILPVGELRKKMSSVLKQIEETGEPVFIVQYSNPRAVLMNFEHYNQLLRELEDLEDIRDMLSAQEEPGRPFKEYLREKGKNV